MLTYAAFFALVGVGKSKGHEELIRHPGRAGETEFVPNTDDMVHRVLPVRIGARATRILPRDADRMIEEFVTLRDKRAAKILKSAAREDHRDQLAT
jgi:hypothetical protein